MSTDKIPLKGTNRIPLAGAIAKSESDPNKRIEVTVVLKPSTSLTKEVLDMYKTPISKRKPLTHEESVQKYGATDEDIDKVKKFALENGLEVIRINKAGRSLRLAGPVSSMNKAFNVTLRHYESPKGTYRGREGEIFVPSNLKDIVLTVLGLDNRPIFKPHFRKFNKANNLNEENSITRTSYYPADLKTIYNFPTDVNGEGQTIGLIELAGDGITASTSGYHPEDIQAFFQQIGLTPPILKDVFVDDATNSPDGQPVNNIENGDGEVVLDIEVAGAIAPGAKINVYFGPLASDDGFRDAINVAINGDANGQNSLPPGSVLSISWGGPEIHNQPGLIEDIDHLFAVAAAKHMTICVASGDDGSRDNGPDGSLNVDFPASSPWVLSCGGTSLSQKSVNSEVAWNNTTNGSGNGATGGGISSVFDINGTNTNLSHATYQTNIILPSSNAKLNRRGVPDVSGVADPLTGYNIWFNGQMNSNSNEQSNAFGGTSAVAPLYAGLITLINKSLGRAVGFINPIIYENVNVRNTFHDITSGNNNMDGDSDYTAGVGWDACTGLGSPNGIDLLNALRAST
jgi:kumamolisin